LNGAAFADVVVVQMQAKICLGKMFRQLQLLLCESEWMTAGMMIDDI
jgi:hypothetical protein